MQLYRIPIAITWSNPSQWRPLIIRPLYFGSHRKLNWIVSNPQLPSQHLTHITGFLDHENLPIDTKVIFLAALESKLWLLLCFGGHRGTHLGCFIHHPSNQFITSIVEFLEPENIPLDTNLIFLADLESKIWYFCILAAILAAILDFSKCSRVTACYPLDAYSSDSREVTYAVKNFIIPSLQHSLPKWGLSPELHHTSVAIKLHCEEGKCLG